MPDNKKRIPIGVRFLLFYFLLFCKYYFQSIQISYRVKCFNQRANLYNLSDSEATSDNNKLLGSKNLA